MTTVLFTCHHVLRNKTTFAPMLEQHGITVLQPEMIGQQFDASQMIAMLPGVDVLIAGDDEIPRAVLEAGKAGGLKAIVKWGIGTDGIDKVAATDLGIPVYNTPGVFSNEVADLALTFLLLLCRPLHKMHAATAAGGWAPVSGRTLNGLAVGIIGLGAIGRAIAARCGGFGMSVKGFDPVAIAPEVLAGVGVAEQVDLDTLYATSDVIFVASALTATNRHMLNDDAFGKMKQGVFLINVGRGPLVDEEALVRALESGKIGAAGLDVFEVEPLPMSSPIRRFDNIVYGCHNGSNTVQSVARINTMTVGMTLQVLGFDDPGKHPLNQVA